MHRPDLHALSPLSDTQDRPTTLRVVSIALFLIILSTPIRADFNDGVVALMTGKYEQALTTFVPLAEMSDHAYAQYFLARMYASGQGVTRDHATAALWYRKAAKKGIADAQYRLGRLYALGEGVPKDIEYAFGWYSVATHLRHEGGVEALKSTESKLSKSQLTEAKRLARDLIDNYGVVPKSTSRDQ